MSQQLHLFFTDPALDASPDSTSDPLVEETRELFQHQGSTAELIERIVAATKALNELCQSSKN